MGLWHRWSGRSFRHLGAVLCRQGVNLGQDTPLTRTRLHRAPAPYDVKHGTSPAAVGILQWATRLRYKARQRRELVFATSGAQRLRLLMSDIGDPATSSSREPISGPVASKLTDGGIVAVACWNFLGRRDTRRYCRRPC